MPYTRKTLEQTKIPTSYSRKREWDEKKKKDGRNYTIGNLRLKEKNDPTLCVKPRTSGSAMQSSALPLSFARRYVDWEARTVLYNERVGIGERLSCEVETELITFQTGWWCY